MPTELIYRKKRWTFAPDAPIKHHGRLCYFTLVFHIPGVLYNEFQPRGLPRAFGWGVIRIARAVAKPLDLSNYCSIINTLGKWLLIDPNDIAYPCASTVNVTTIKVERQGQLNIFLFIPENELLDSV